MIAVDDIECISANIHPAAAIRYKVGVQFVCIVCLESLIACVDLTTRDH